ncbi:HDOD domain-containing protein [bacterium]|nr:HDOD domain-containing protein [bacterium]
MDKATPSSEIDWSAIRRKLLLDDGAFELPSGWKLPILPRVVTQFLQQANRPDYDIRKLAKLLEQDAQMTCELLKYTNSAAMGLRHKATTVHQALVNLGVRRAKMVLLTAAIHSTIKKFNSKLFDLHQFWADNLERGLFAREVAGEIGADIDLSYTGAMLQDFLLPVLGQLNVKAYVAYWKEAKGVPMDLIDYELKEFGVHHAQVAAACLQQWNVPDELVCAVLCHHFSFEQIQQLGLEGTHVHAVAASSLIPLAVLQHEKSGVVLSEWDQADVSFDLCDIAERVDAFYMHHDTQSSSDREPLLARLERCLTEQLTESMTKESLVDRQFGNFVLEQCIGEGAMGTVYRARHTMLDRPAAVKVLNKQELSRVDIARFEREVQLCSRLTHPNTISIYDYGRTSDGVFYYVMELVEGLTLKQLVQLFGPLSPARTIYILRQICSSLQEAHDQGIVHRDIKPENIILSSRGTQGDLATVLDFGLVRDLTNRDMLPTDACLSGTPLYMAPESINDPGFSSPACDLYAIGAVGYFLLCGQPLFTGNDALDICLKQLQELPPPPAERLKKPLPADLEQLVMSCLNKDPQKRPVSASLLEQGLMNCLDANRWTNQDAASWWKDNVHQNEQGLARSTADATLIVGNETTL